jgi:hypothetical protein
VLIKYFVYNFSVDIKDPEAIARAILDDIMSTVAGMKNVAGI